MKVIKRVVGNYTYTALDRNVEFDPEEKRDGEGIKLYTYLIKTAEENASKYEDGTAIYKHKLTLFTSNKNPLNTQPIVVIEKNPLEFDLALRKYITKIDGTNVTVSRKPVVDESTLKDNDTATYNHPKNP